MCLLINMAAFKGADGSYGVNCCLLISTETPRTTKETQGRFICLFR